MEEKKAYSTSPELMHYGVKGMKWKDHAYRRLVNGQYVYDQNWRPSDRPGTVTRPATSIRSETGGKSASERFPTRQKKFVGNAYYKEKDYRERHSIYAKPGPSTNIPSAHYNGKLERIPTSTELRRQTNTGYGKSDHLSRISKEGYRDKLGKDYDKYSSYYKKTDNNTHTTTFVKDRTKNKGLVTKSKTLRDETITWDDGSKSRHVTKKVEPGRYDSYGKALKGESKKAYKAATSSVKDAYRVTSNKVSAGAKEMKRVGVGAKAAAKSLKSSSKDLKRAADNAINTPVENAKWIYDSINSQKTTKDKIDTAKGIYTENYAKPVERTVQNMKSNYAMATRKKNGYKKTSSNNDEIRTWTNQRQSDGSYKLVPTKETTYTDKNGNRIITSTDKSRLLSRGSVYKDPKTGKTTTLHTKGALEVAGAKAIKSAKKATKKKNGR